MVAALKVKRMKQNSNLELLENLIKKQAEQQSADFAIGEEAGFPEFEITEGVFFIITISNVNKVLSAGPKVVFRFICSSLQ